MFRFKKPKQESSSPSRKPRSMEQILADSAEMARLGAMALREERERQEAELSLGGQINQGISAARDVQKAFIADALKRGVSRDKLPTVISDAMVAQVIPRIIAYDLQWRGYMDTSYALVDGRLPADLIDVYVDGDPNSDDFSANFYVPYERTDEMEAPNDKFRIQTIYDQDGSPTVPGDTPLQEQLRLLNEYSATIPQQQ